MPTTALAKATYRQIIFDGFPARERKFPWRSRRDPYQVLIGEVLLQRTRGEHAVQVYREFLRRWPNAERLARARVGTIEAVIHPLGLSKRAAILSRLGKAIATTGVPIDPVELDRLPGVGPYAAHSVPVFAADANLPVVDWVIARVLRRYFGLAGARRPNQDLELWRLAAELAAGGGARTLWLGTLDFAAAVCKPRPLCQACPLERTCHYRQLELAAA
jgi:A/G-specific adenine glycosylase